MAMYGYVGLCRAMYGYVGLCMAVYGCVGLCRAMLGFVGLCKAIERNVFHILANGEPLYDAYTTYLPRGPRRRVIRVKVKKLPCHLILQTYVIFQFEL